MGMGWALGLGHIDLVIGLQLQQALACLMLAFLYVVQAVEEKIRLGVSLSYT